MEQNNNINPLTDFLHRLVLKTVHTQDIYPLYPVREATIWYITNSFRPRHADELGSGMRNTNKYTKLYSGGVPKFVEENTFEIIVPIENVPELQVGGNVITETNRVPKSAEDAKLVKLDEQQLQVYNYVLANEAITTKEAKVLLGLQDRRARKILADMCDAGVLMKVGATSNLKYVLQKIND